MTDGLFFKDFLNYSYFHCVYIDIQKVAIWMSWEEKENFASGKEPAKVLGGY